MFSSTAVRRIVIGTILSSMAFDIGFYGLDHAWLVFGGLMLTGGLIGGVAWLRNRYESSGARQSRPVGRPRL